MASEREFFEHSEIMDVLSDIIPFQPFMHSTLGKEFITNDPKIYFDKIEADKRIAVFVSPRVPAKARPKKGFQVDSYEPGYIRDKDLILPDHVFTRRPGEPMGLPMTPAERYRATIVDLADKQRERLARRLELMTCQLYMDGKYRMKGDSIDVIVDQARKAENTVTLTTTNRWLDANTSVSPWDDLEDWINRCQVPIVSLRMGLAAWRYLKKDPKFDKMVYTDLLAKQNSTLIYNIQQNQANGVTYRGTVGDGDIPIFTYAQDYTDPESGTDTLYIPTDAVIGIPDSSYGYQAYGRIQDAEAEYMGMPFFFKNWIEKELGTPILTMQSAPMILHTKINSTFSARTGATATGA